MKTKDLHLKITEDDYQRIRTAAYEEGISMGEYVRRCLNNVSITSPKQDDGVPPSDRSC